MKELDRVIVDEKRVARKSSKKQSASKLTLLKKKSIHITQEDQRSKVKATINPGMI